MKIIIIGATGTIGRSVVNLLAPDHDIVKVGFKPVWNVSGFEAIKKIKEFTIFEV
jgi:nucleoside-diphosphate-sugar epimerase